MGRLDEVLVGSFDGDLDDDIDGNLDDTMEGNKVGGVDGDLFSKEFSEVAFPGQFWCSESGGVFGCSPKSGKISPSDGFFC